VGFANAILHKIFTAS